VSGGPAGRWLVAAFLLASTAAAPLVGQPTATSEPKAAAHIILDKPIHAGDLVVFPSLDDPKVYYYISDQPHLAVDENGNPQFSFLRWVENVRSGAEEAEAREGGGGGIVHALVELSVTKEQIQDAQRELQRTVPGAKIAGFVPFSSGIFGIVSSFKDPKGGFSTQVLGLGKAPLLDGEKAAISIQLTKLGAKVLWESFATPTPDISFSFEMVLEGYHSPLRATIEADWEQVYKHKAFGVGLASTYLNGEITGAFDDLRKNGAIKITQVGDDSAMNQLIKTTYEKLIEAMFTKVDTLDPAQASKAGAQGPADRAAARLKEERGVVEARNAIIRTENAAIRTRNAARDKARAEMTISSDTSGKAAQAQSNADSLKAQAETARHDAELLKTQCDAAKKPATRPIGAFERTQPPQYGGIGAGQTAALEDQPPWTWLQDKPPAAPKPPPPKPPPSKPAPPPAPPSEPSKPSEPAKPPTEPAKPPGEPAKPTATPTPSSPPSGDAAACDVEVNAAKRKADTLDADAKKAQTEADALKKGTRNADTERLAGESNEKEKSEDSGPSFSVFASYEMRETRQTGTFVLDMNKYITGSIPTRFDENIGDLRRLMKDTSHFHQVNLDDPLYKQREIVAMVDGFDAKDFGEWVNFVTVQLRKKHAQGAETTDEVRIDRKNFNSAGNAFKLLYGWDGDTDRKKWLDYEYRATWSFFGGREVALPWQHATAGAINLAPPFERRKISLEADPDRIAAAGVRLITTKIFYTSGGEEQVKQVTLNPAKKELSADVQFLLPANAYDYGYEVLWRMPGNKTVSSGRQTTSEGVLFVDEIPTTSAGGTS
jgi:hypothetical protein